MILIGCEESQVVCKAFRAAGYNDAYSCDLLPTRGNPEWHIQGDVVDAVKSQQWDLIILHPDCTAMAICGNKHYGDGMPKNRERHSSIKWTVELFDTSMNHARMVALENPGSVIFPELSVLYADHIRFNIFYIQPWQFGHGETKLTGMATIGLPRLMPENIVAGRDDRIHKMKPGPNRKRDRSETYQGIAKAIVNQYGPLVSESS